MSNLDLSIKPLYSLVLKQVCNTMNESTLQYVLKLLPPKICVDVLWVALDIDGFFNPEWNSIDKGSNLAQIRSDDITYTNKFIDLTFEKLEEFGTTQQVKFIDRFNWSSFFDQEFILKLIDVPEIQDNLFILFQICVQIKGVNFPFNLAEEWIKTEIPDGNKDIYFTYLENGLKLGIFLGDSGWVVESVKILERVYEIATTNCVYQNLDLQLLKTIQCLTNWLRAITLYECFDDAKVVLQHMFHTINIIEQIEEKTFCIANAYLAISKYYCAFLKYNEAWCWVVKAIFGLHENSEDLKIMVLNHAYRICCETNKLKTAQQLRKQINACNKNITYNLQVDIVRNKAYYLHLLGHVDETIKNFYKTLDLTRNLFGYYNLHTVIVLIEYARVHHTFTNSIYKKDESMRCILQAIYIMQKIQIPENHVLLLSARLLKSKILEETVVHSDHYHGIDRKMPLCKRTILQDAETMQLDVLRTHLQLFGENSLYVAKSYSQLGTLYMHMDSYLSSENMYINGIEIKILTLGVDHLEVARSISNLAYLYTRHLHRFKEAEELLLQSIKIFEYHSAPPHREILSNLEELITVYRRLKNVEKINKYSNYFNNINALYKKWIENLESGLDFMNCTKDDLSLEKFKCILIGCTCVQ